MHELLHELHNPIIVNYDPILLTPQLILDTFHAQITYLNFAMSHMRELKNKFLI
jgi:hypothetical protein